MMQVTIIELSYANHESGKHGEQENLDHVIHGEDRFGSYESAIGILNDGLDIVICAPNST